jgi:DHA1 family multidrug resistance protein-like MFS transporter
MAGIRSLKGTPRSSITVVDHDLVEDYEKRDGKPPLDPRKQSLEREISKVEQRAEEYGGDDIHDPTPPPQDSPAASEHDVVDPDLVLWDGPDDPCNPQNWSRRYKWCLTVICSVMTLNV